MALVLSGSNGVQDNSGAIVSGTAVTASGTAIDFTGIPSWVKRVTVMFNNVSTSGASNLLLQIGSGTIATSGYLGSYQYVGGTAASNNNPTNAFMLAASVGAAFVFQGTGVLTLLGSNIWTYQQILSRSDGNNTYFCSGSNALAGALDRIRITTVNGTDTFDAGTINIMWE